MKHNWDAENYHKISDFQEQLGRKLIIEFKGHSPRSVCDVGCGTGRVTRILADHFPHAMIYAIDPDPGMLEEARKNLGDLSHRIRFLPSDASSLRLPEPVDLLFSNFVFQWISNYQILFKNLYKVLALDGFLIAQWPTKKRGNLVLEEKLRFHNQFKKYFKNWVDPAHYSTKEEAKNLLSRARFHTIQVQQFNPRTDFDSRERFASFARTVKLRHYLPYLPDSETEARFVDCYADGILEEMGKYSLDVTCLKVTARK